MTVMTSLLARRSTLLTLPALALALVPAQALAQPAGSREQEFLFASTPWGADERQVIRSIEAAGFRYRQKDADGDLEFSGRVMDHSTKIFAFISRQTGVLTSVQVNIGTPDEKARDVFRRMRDSLIAKYGQPNDDYAFFQKPYFEGDGFEAQAIRQGKGHFASFWKGRNSGLMVRITDQLAVRVLYEGPAASGELRRRNAEDLKAF
jgi:hypothetical protein